MPRPGASLNWTLFFVLAGLIAGPAVAFAQPPAAPDSTAAPGAAPPPDQGLGQAENRPAPTRPPIGSRASSERPRIEVKTRPETWQLGLVDLDRYNPLYYLDGGLAALEETVADALGDFAHTLDADTTVKRPLRFGVRLRQRYEAVSHHGFGVDPTIPDNYAGQASRWRFTFGFVTSDFRLDLEMWQAQYLTDDPASPAARSPAESDWDLGVLGLTLLGFGGEPIRLPVSSTFVRVAAFIGRAPLTVQRGRLIGSNDFILRGDAWDSMILAFQDEDSGAALSLFYAREVRYQRISFDQAEHGWHYFGVLLSGVRPFERGDEGELSWDRALLNVGRRRRWLPPVIPGEALDPDAAGLDVLLLWQLHPTHTIVGETGTIDGIDRYIVDVRTGIPLFDALALEMEVAYQWGRRGGDTVRAFGMHGEARLVPAGARIPVALSLLLDFAQGDGDPTDGVTHTFTDIRPDLHGAFGFQDLIAWRNLVQIGARLSVQFAQNLQVSAAVHYLRSHQSADAVYAPELRTLLGPGEGAPNVEVGLVVDATLKYRYSSRVRVDIGVSSFIPGKRLRAAGLRAAPKLVFVQAEIGFGGP